MIQINKSFHSDEIDGADPEFQPGTLVRHRRYGYRGVVVAADRNCKADPTWYMSNKTQPDRNQPWYHVFVHDSKTITYAAQTSLAADDSGEPIDHPLTEIFFSGMEAGKYVRNETPWPG